MDTISSQFATFTACTKKTLAVAQEEARRRGQAMIEPEHLLLGLLCAPQDTACEVLQAGGVTLETARADAESLLRPILPPEQATRGEITLAPRSKQVITYALEEMAFLKQPDFATGHFLLGMVREERISELFAIWELDLLAVRASMQRLGQPAIEREQLTPATASAVELDAAHQQKVARVARQIGIARFIFIIVIVALVAGVLIMLQLIPGLPLNLFLPFINLLANPVLGWEPVAGWSPLFVLLGSLLAGVVLLLLALPLSWYITQVLLRRSGLVKTSTLRWLRAVVLNFLPFLCEFCILVEVMTLLIVVQPQTWWAWSALAVTLFFVLMGGWVGSHRYLWLRRRLVPLREGKVAERFQAVRERLGLPVCQLYQLKVAPGSRAANAFFAGWGKGRRVILTDSMIERFSLDEIEVILAHELGHLASHDIWIRYLINGLNFLAFFGLVQFYATIFLTPDPDTSTVLFLLVLFLLLIIFLRVQRRYKRYQEDRADEFALLATNNVQAFKNAMTRLTNLNLIVAAPKKLASRQATHPTLLKRLQHADKFAARQNTRQI